MYCPECGHDADEAKFCPECGTDLKAASQARRGRAKKSTAAAPVRTQRPRTARRAAERLGEPAPTQRSRSVLLIWLGFAAIAVVVVAVVVIAGGNSADGPAASPAGPVAADTSGSYRELVGRANDLYDQGVVAFGKNDEAGGIKYFKAAAEVYRAAWKKQPGDPSVGTDLAVALFYSRHHDDALKQIDVVLKKNPAFQSGHLNKGIFLQNEASEAKDGGDAQKGADLLAQARSALEKAVSLDPTSEAGKHAAEQLKSL